MPKIFDDRADIGIETIRSGFFLIHFFFQVKFINMHSKSKANGEKWSYIILDHCS